MAEVLLPLAEGFEEIEGVVLIDLLRRGGISVVTASVSGDRNVIGAHRISVTSDAILADMKDRKFDAVVLPGGMPGTTHLVESEVLGSILRRHHQDGALIGAICAAPSVLGKHGILAGRRATCYPGFESKLAGATLSDARVVEDSNLITSRGPGTAVDFALLLIRRLAGGEKADEVARSILHPRD